MFALSQCAAIAANHTSAPSDPDRGVHLTIARNVVIVFELTNATSKYPLFNPQPAAAAGTVHFIAFFHADIR